MLVKYSLAFSQNVRCHVKRIWRINHRYRRSDASFIDKRPTASFATREARRQFKCESSVERKHDNGDVHPRVERQRNPIVTVRLAPRLTLMNLFYPDGPEDPMVKVAYRKLLDSVINFLSVGEGERGRTGWVIVKIVASVPLALSDHLIYSEKVR